MSSSRSTPFSFSPEARALLGTPNRLNEDVRTAFPNLFGAALGDNLAYINDGRLGPGAMVRWRAQPPIRAGTPVGIFSGHVVTEWHRRDTNTLPLPPLHIHGVCTRLSVHASASVGRAPTPTNAALYNHHCTEPTLRGEWWTAGQIPCLVAVSVYDLVPGDRLTWNFNQHDPTAPYAMTLPQSHAYHRPLRPPRREERRKNHFIPCDEQTKSGNFTTKIRKFFRFHCVRAASNPFRLVLDTVTPCTAVHGSPRPLYPSSFKCAPAFTPVRSRDLPGGPGCAHGSS